jgi:hypothetical protein
MVHSARAEAHLYKSDLTKICKWIVAKENKIMIQSDCCYGNQTRRNKSPDRARYS